MQLTKGTKLAPPDPVLSMLAELQGRVNSQERKLNRLVEENKRKSASSEVKGEAGKTKTS